MNAARPFIERNIHPTVIVNAYSRALDESVKIINNLARPIDISKDSEVEKALCSCIGAKFASKWGQTVTKLALKAARTIMTGDNLNKLNLEIKRYAKVEKIPGGMLEDSEVLDGVMFNKDITHPKMRRKI